MFSKLKLFFTVLLLFSGTYLWINRGPLLSLFLKYPIIQEFGQERIADITAEIKKEILAPPPLRVLKEIPASFLTNKGTIFWTNNNRVQNNLSPLKENVDLDKIALLRLSDMFERQYFAHVASDGASAETVAKTVGYDYLAIGENLALGNFVDDKDLVDAWMASPGHRANILNNHYSQIGVAVKQGLFEGKETWLGVQIFALPASACPTPEDSIKSTIENGKTKLGNLEGQLTSLKESIQNMSSRDSSYTSLLNAYNAMVNEYNNLIRATQSLVTSYNNQVSNFNACVNGVRQ